MSDDEHQISSPPHTPEYDHDEANDVDTHADANNVWIEYHDEEGRAYYHNEATDVTEWELPPDAIVKKPEEEAETVEDADAAVEDEGAVTEQDPSAGNDLNEAGEADVPMEGEGEADVPVGEAEAEAEWTKYQDDDGNDYYYNSISGETQWERPDGFIEPAGDQDDQGAVEQEVEAMETEGGELVDTGTEQGQPTGSSGHIEAKGQGEPDTQQGVDAPVEEEVIPEPEPQTPPRDPKELAIENAEEMLNKPDAVIEPDAAKHLITLASAKGAPVAIKSLSSSYVGQTAICGILSRWLVDLKTANEKEGNTSTKMGTIEAFDLNKLHQANAESIRQLIEQIIARTAKSNFTDEAQQRILNLSKKERQFFEEMMEHERWRRLLIDLSAEHKDSALLTLLLQSISKRGYHREIAKRINQSDYFDVFHGMLASELGLLGKLSVNGGKATAEELNDINSTETIVNDLKRQCTSTAYTYIYVIELLEELISRSKAKIKTLSGIKALGLTRATHKWERLREEIEDHMIKPQHNSDGGVSLNPLARKRRADIALTSSELYQQQRRKVRFSEQSNKSNGSEQLRHSVQSGILSTLKKFSMNTSIDTTLADQLLYNPFSDKSLTDEQSRAQLGGLLHNNALSTEYLLRSLFVPGSRAKSTELKMKCSKLVAISVLAAQRDLSKMITNADPSADPEEPISDADQFNTLYKMILQGSTLCEQLENIVKFVVTENTSAPDNLNNASVGAQLSNLCIKCSTVAQGFVMWAKARCSNSDFSSTAAYPLTAPGILSLVRIISNHQPLIRGSAIDIALLFLDHSNSELSYQKMNTIKEQALRLLLIVATKGLAVDVYSAVASKLKNSRSKFDSGLIRYFVAGTLQIMRPPLSLAMVRSLGSMLLLPPCTEAINTVYFDSAKKQKLVTFLGYFEDAVSEKTSVYARPTSHDRSIPTALNSAYKFGAKK